MNCENKKKCENNKKCECKKYIVLQNFWLRDIELFKGQIISEPVSKRWIELRLIAPYKEIEENAKTSAQQVIDRSELDIKLSENDTVVATDSVNTDEVKVIKKPTKKTNSKVVVETPEKSEIVLGQMLKEETENL